MSTIVDLAVRSSIVLVAGLAVAAILPGRSAALRHLVLAAAILAAAAVAPLSLALPGWKVLPAWNVRTAAVATASVPPPVVSSAADVVTPQARPHANAIEPVQSAPDWALLVPYVWAAGFAGTAASLLAGILRLSRVASRARRVREDPWVSITRTIGAAFGLRREVILLQTDAPYLLATWGILRPRVLLPSHAREWPEDRIHAVVCHELAHIRRADWLLQISAQAVLTILWFNPLIWVACARLRRESEQACDDAVLACGVPAGDYASHLLELARKCRRQDFPWAAAATPMAHPSTLERRITAMLNPRLNRTALSRRAVIVTAVALLVLTLPTAAFRAAQAAPATLGGSIYDTTGGVLPGVQLTLEDAQNVKWQAVTNSSGRFEFSNVAAGPYVLAASLPGFRALRQEFELRNKSDWDRAVTLQVGDVQETITVRDSRVAAPAAPSQPRGPQPVRVGGNIRAPMKVYDVHPVYPLTMRQAGREGIVPLDAVIGTDGTVTSVRVLSAQVHPDFAIAAVDAVRQWRFSPTLLNGAPVEVVMTVSVRFSLSD